MAMQEIKSGSNRKIDNATGKGKMRVDLDKLVGGEKPKTNFGVLRNILSSVPQIHITRGEGMSIVGGNMESVIGMDTLTMKFEGGKEKGLKEWTVINTVGENTKIEERGSSIIEQMAIIVFEKKGAKPIGIEYKSRMNESQEPLSDVKFVTHSFDLQDPDVMEVVVKKAQALDPEYEGKSLQQIGKSLQF